MEIRKLFFIEDSKGFQTELNLMERTGVPESR